MGSGQAEQTLSRVQAQSSEFWGLPHELGLPPLMLQDQGEVQRVKPGGWCGGGPKLGQALSDKVPEIYFHILTIDWLNPEKYFRHITSQLSLLKLQLC